MVLDIIKSEEGRKAITEASLNSGDPASGAQMQILATGQGEQLQLAVKQILTDPHYPKALQTLMTDPKFAGEFAKAVNKENMTIHKHLIKDPEYQQSLIEVMKNPEFQKLLMDVMRSSQYRQQTMKVMQDALQSPLFRLELMQLLKRVLAGEIKPLGDTSKESDKTDQANKSDQGDQGSQDKKDQNKNNSQDNQNSSYQQ